MTSILYANDESPFFYLRLQCISRKQWGYRRDGDGEGTVPFPVRFSVLVQLDERAGRHNPELRVFLLHRAHVLERCVLEHGHLIRLPQLLLRVLREGQVVPWSTTTAWPRGARQAPHEGDITANLYRNPYTVGGGVVGEARGYPPGGS